MTLCVGLRKDATKGREVVRELLGGEIGIVPVSDVQVNQRMPRGREDRVTPEVELKGVAWYAVGHHAQKTPT